MGECVIVGVMVLFLSFVIWDYYCPMQMILLPCFCSMNAWDGRGESHHWPWSCDWWPPQCPCMHGFCEWTLQYACTVRAIREPDHMEEPTVHLQMSRRMLGSVGALLPFLTCVLAVWCCVGALHTHWFTHTSDPRMLQMVMMNIVNHLWYSGEKRSWSAALSMLKSKERCA